MKTSVFIVMAFAIIAASAIEVKVTLNIFSGSEDPSWTVGGDAAYELLASMPSDVKSVGVDVRRPIPWYRMGYRGFEVSVIKGDDVTNFAIYNSPVAEMALLHSANLSLPLQVVAHVRDETVRLTNLMELHDGVMPMDDSVAPNGECDIPVRGPDNFTTYAPQTENCGFFVKHVTQNNCYNYGNDVVTNTFAQPGRGSGQKWKYDTCEDIKASAIRDGLVWVNSTVLPTVNPATGHFIALLIWPNTNFHWVRLDSSPAGGWWSHKPGQTPVRNVDSNNNKISDPSKQNFSPWTQFCGYMLSVPSTVNIG